MSGGRSPGRFPCIRVAVIQGIPASCARRREIFPPNLGDASRLRCLPCAVSRGNLPGHESAQLCSDAPRREITGPPHIPVETSCPEGVTPFALLRGDYPGG